MVEALEVDAKSKRAVFFPDEEDWSAMGKMRGTDEPCSKVLINELMLMQSCKFLLRQGVNGTIGWGGALVHGDFEIIWSMVS